MGDLFSGIPVGEFEPAKNWYEKLLGYSPAFLPHETEAVWKLAEHQYIYIVQSPEHAGHAIVMHMVDDLESLIDLIAERGIDFERQEYFPNNVCKVTYKDFDGNQISFGGIQAQIKSGA